MNIELTLSVDNIGVQLSVVKLALPPSALKFVLPLSFSGENGSIACCDGVLYSWRNSVLIQYDNFVISRRFFFFYKCNIIILHRSALITHDIIL